jgi:hypothetical protein
VPTSLRRRLTTWAPCWPSPRRFRQRRLDRRRDAALAFSRAAAGAADRPAASAWAPGAIALSFSPLRGRTDANVQMSESRIRRRATRSFRLRPRRSDHAVPCHLCTIARNSPRELRRTGSSLTGESRNNLPSPKRMHLIRVPTSSARLRVWLLPGGSAAASCWN